MRTLLRCATLVLAALSTTTMGDATVKSDNAILLPRPSDPTICFRIWFKVGAQNDPHGKEGLAEIAAAMLTDGATLKNSYEQIIDKLYPLAASYDASVSMEMTVIYGRVHKDNLNAYYELFLDAITCPAFQQSDLDRIKSQTLNYLENTLRYSSDEELGKAVLSNAVFAGTAYGHITAGTVTGVKRITLEDVKEFYKTYYTKENLVIGLGGGYNGELPATLRKDLNRLASGTPAPLPVVQPARWEGFRATIIEKDAPATAISMGVPIDIVRGRKDWYALAIANSWLGEHRNSSSHLYQVIREERGLNYGDYSYIEHYPRGGLLSKPPQNVCRRVQMFEIWIRPVPNETGHFALRAALREYKRLVERGMTAAEFTLTKKNKKKNVLHYAPTTMARLGYAIDDRFYGIKGSHLARFRSMMSTLTLADVNRAIKKHWQYGTMQIAVVTRDAQALREALMADAPSPISYKTPKPESVLREDKEIMVFPVKLAPENVKVLPLSGLFE